MDSDNKSPNSHKDLTEPWNCLCAALGRAQRAVYRRYEAALKKSGVTPAQFTILATLDFAGETKISSLAKIISIDRTTLTRNLVPLVSAGLIADRRDDDQRVRRLGLTGKGRKVQSAAARSWTFAQADFIAKLGEGNAGILLGNLSKFDKI